MTKSMKILLVLIMVLPVVFIMAGCEDNNDHIVYISDNNAPPTPQGVYSVTADQSVYLFWNPIEDIEGDFKEYVVYRSDSHPDAGYMEIGRTQLTEFVDEGLTNGHTYYYAVSSLDKSGNLSPLSYEYVPDTPRPEGFNEYIITMETEPNKAGWALALQQRVRWDNLYSDFYVDEDGGTLYLNVANDATLIQDMGYTENFDVIDYAPPADAGWSANGWVEAIKDHTYVILTAESNFAKVRVTNIKADTVFFDWGYQVDVLNRELKRVPQ